MVFVQEDSSQKKNVIYYLSKGCIGPELRYPHVEKLALELVHDVQHLQHYILLCKMTIISDSNRMQHLLNRQIIGYKYLKWIVILQ
jgi:hypothetical protein